MTPHPSRPSRPLCSRCGLPLRTCLCPWIRPTANPLPVLILQHPEEAAQAKGSARLLRLSLLHSRCEVAEAFEPDTLAKWLLESPGFGPVRSVLLYPTTPAPLPPALSPAVSPAPAGHKAPSPQLVLLDGTWRQSRQLLQRHPALQALPRLPWLAPPPSRYGVRKAQRPAQRSTLEAACWALAALDPEVERYAALLQAFDGWVAQGLERRQ